ncbi:MAG TPA: tRNA lysidine(34) synthetase TilS [Acidimicrobiia bacterium]
MIEADFDGIDAPVIVACSGGPDSVALLVLAVEAGLEPVAVYVDHRLRPSSADDGKVVERAASELGAAFEPVTVSVGDGGNLEARAREARYAALEECRARRGASAVLVGHTADDQAETVLLNLLRGSASPGLAGMPARRDHIARPLLNARRADLAALVRARGLDTVHDPSNDEQAFRRNWLRHEVLPLLSKGADRDLVPVLVRQASVLRAESELLDAMADQLLVEAGDVKPSARVLAAAHPAVARRAVRRWLGSPPPSLAEVDRVLAVARCEHRATELNGHRRVWRSEGRLHQELASSP